MENTIKELCSKKSLLVGVTGSIAVLGITSYLIAFTQFFKEVRVIMTPAACQFIPHNSLEYICSQVFVDEMKGNYHTSHVDVARSSDLVMVLPATANTIAYVANGFAHNFLTQTLLSYSGSILFFPNMNSLMWQKAAVQRNISQLQQDGHIICPPIVRDTFEQASRSFKKNYSMPLSLEVLEFTASYLSNQKATI